MSAPLRFRDKIPVPWWLSDRVGTGPGLNVGYRFLWGMIAPLDAAAEVLVQGIKARFPGVGTDTAIPYIERSTGILRGESESVASWALRAIKWLETWPHAGQQENLALLLHYYLGNNPRVRIVNRQGKWVTVETDASITIVEGVTFDWDSVSNPERAGYWSEMFIIVYPSEFALSSGDFNPPELGIGHDVTRKQYDGINNIMATWKAAHTLIRAVIWTSNTALFDPLTPGSLPNGNWGQWSSPGTDPRVPSDRRISDCRYWEPL